MVSGTLRDSLVFEHGTLRDMFVRVFFNFEDVLFKFAYVFCECGISDSGALAVFIADVFYGTRDSVSCVFSLLGVANGLLFFGFIYFFCDRGDFRLWGSGWVHSRCLLRDSGLGTRSLTCLRCLGSRRGCSFVQCLLWEQRPG